MKTLNISVLTTLVGLLTWSTKADLLTVMQPSSLAEEVEIKASLGNFGHITYGQTIMGNVRRAIGDNKFGCNPLSWSDFADVKTESQNAGTMSLFVLVDRGHCSNPTKVRNIENFGAAVGLIADYKPEDMESVLMVDAGGAGHSLVTPGFMIDFFSAQKIEMAIDAGSAVIMRASLTISKPDNEIEIGLLYSSSIDLDSQSMHAFTSLALESAKTRKKALLDLHIHTFACPLCPEPIRQENCVSDGQYCAFFPKVSDLAQEMKDPEDYEMDNQAKKPTNGDVKAEFTGRELLMASLHEKCQHREIAKIIANGDQDKLNFEQKFINRMVLRLNICEDLYQAVGVFKRQCLLEEDQIPELIRPMVEECVHESFEEEGNYESNNRLLEDDVVWAREHHLDFHPSITINDFTYRGDIEFADIREAICAAYQERPQHCNLDEIWKAEAKQRPFGANELNDHVTDKRKRHHTRLLSVWHVLGIVFVFLIVQFFIWLYLQRKTRQETNNQLDQRVHLAMHEYFALTATADEED